MVDRYGDFVAALNETFDLRIENRKVNVTENRSAMDDLTRDELRAILRWVEARSRAIQARRKALAQRRNALYKQVHELPLPPSVFRKDTPKRLELIVLKALKKNLLERYKNVDEMLKSKDPKIMRFLGVTEGNGKALGLDEKYAYNIIKQVGNYGEVFERNVGMGSPLGISRGLNALWMDGGIQYAPPIR